MKVTVRLPFQALTPRISDLVWAIALVLTLTGAGCTWFRSSSKNNLEEAQLVEQMKARNASIAQIDATIEKQRAFVRKLKDHPRLSEKDKLSRITTVKRNMAVQAESLKALREENQKDEEKLSRFPKALGSVRPTEPPNP